MSTRMDTACLPGFDALDDDEEGVVTADTLEDERSPIPVTDNAGRALISNEVTPHARTSPDEGGGCSTRTPGAMPASVAAAPCPARLPTGDYRARNFNRSLSPAQRRAVARRRRFRTMPWIRPASQPDADDGDFLP